MTPSSPPPARPLPIETGGSADDAGRIVPPGWLDHAPVTRALLALNVAVFAVQLALEGGKLFAHAPANTLLAFGAATPFFVVGDNRWETLVTACFLHDGFLHVGFNMLALWQAGPLVERAVGSARMAPMYLVAGAAGNALYVAQAWLVAHPTIEALETPVVGASGAICGLVAAALIVGWRVQGWRGPLTQAMTRWLGFVFIFGLVAGRSGAHIANAAHVGGALAGAAIALTWRRGRSYGSRATAAVLAACTAALVACIALVGVRDRTDPFATWGLQQRNDFTTDALREGRCNDAREGLLAVERLRAKLAPVTSLRNRFESTCGGADRARRGAPGGP
jgi:rhomboid protease GluP